MADNDDVKKVEIDTSAIIDKVSADVKDKVSADITDSVLKDVSPKVAEQVAQDVTDKIVEKIQGSKTPQSDAPWAKERRTPKNYEEVAEYGKQIAIDEMNKLLEQKEKEKEEKQKQSTKSEEARQKSWNEYWEKQVQKLTDEGKLPPISDDKIAEKVKRGEQLTEQEMQDQGVKARAELFQIAREKKEGNLELVYYRDYSQKQKPAGTTAPIFGTSKTPVSSKSSGFTYEEVHNARDFSDLLNDE